MSDARAAHHLAGARAAADRAHEALGAGARRGVPGLSDRRGTQQQPALPPRRRARLARAQPRERRGLRRSRSRRARRRGRDELPRSSRLPAAAPPGSARLAARGGLRGPAARPRGARVRRAGRPAAPLAILAVTCLALALGLAAGILGLVLHGAARASVVLGAGGVGRRPDRRRRRDAARPAPCRSIGAARARRAPAGCAGDGGSGIRCGAPRRSLGAFRHTRERVAGLGRHGDAPSPRRSVRRSARPRSASRRSRCSAASFSAGAGVACAVVSFARRRGSSRPRASFARLLRPARGRRAGGGLRAPGASLDPRRARSTAAGWSAGAHSDRRCRPRRRRRRRVRRARHGHARGLERHPLRAARV